MSKNHFFLLNYFFYLFKIIIMNTFINMQDILIYLLISLKEYQINNQNFKDYKEKYFLNYLCYLNKNVNRKNY